MKITVRQLESIIAYIKNNFRFDDYIYCSDIGIDIDGFSYFGLVDDIYGGKSVVCKFKEKYWNISRNNILTADFPDEFIHLIRKSLGEYATTIMVIRKQRRKNENDKYF